MEKKFETILVESESHLALVTLNRPEVANAFNTCMAKELRDLFRDFTYGSDQIRCVILTGSGEKAFCAGGDLKERHGMTDSDWYRQHAVFEQLAMALMDLPVPLIGAINGAAFGGGMELILACDFAYAASHARFALTETTLGIMPGMGGTQYLPSAVGIRRAREIVLTGSAFSAAEALAWGVVNKVCELDVLLDQTRAQAERIASNGPIAIREARRALNHAVFADLKAGYQVELDAYNQTVPTTDRREGITAFNEKRKPMFIGE